MSLEAWRFVQPKLLKLIPVSASYNTAQDKPVSHIEFELDKALGLDVSCRFENKESYWDQPHDANFDRLEISPTKVGINVYLRTLSSSSEPEVKARRDLDILSKYFSDATVNMAEEAVYAGIVREEKKKLAKARQTLIELNKKLEIAHAL